MAIVAMAESGLGDLLTVSCSESLPTVSRVRGVAMGVVNGGDGDLVAHDKWAESVVVAFLCANPSRINKDTAFYWSDDII